MIFLVVFRIFRGSLGADRESRDSILSINHSRPRNDRCGGSSSPSFFDVSIFRRFDSDLVWKAIFSKQRLRKCPRFRQGWLTKVCVSIAIVFGTVNPAVGGETGHWAYRPIRHPVLPEVKHERWVRTPIDRFILQRLERENINPFLPASRTTLIRRVTLDLIGLPPSPEEVEVFVRDRRPDAYERLVDRLLASPHYGERWATPWMDLCHYGDTDGFLTDQLRPFAWRYRQWLIDSLNADKPFNAFTIEQLAGDLLPGATTDQKIATGFLRQTLSNREGGAEPEEFRVLQVIERTRMIGAIWLGLTTGCAQCHDHKHDAISQREFYQLYAFFNNADEINVDAPLPGQWKPYQAQRSDYEKRRRDLIAPIAEELWELERRWEKRLLQAHENPGRNAHWDRQWELLGLIWGGGRGEGQLEGVEIVKRDLLRRTAREQDDILDFFLAYPGGIDSRRYADLKLDKVREKLEELNKDLPPLARAPTMRAALNPRATYVHLRGDFRSRGEDVRPATPACLPPLQGPGDDPASDRVAAVPPRLALARWLVSPDHPLTARVTVNRLWQEFFGRGIVATPEDFGTHGAQPSHPELLDWLASELIAGDWSIKSMQRMIVLSATYRQSSRPRPQLEETDPENILLARQNSLRLSAEAIRDVSLAVSGLLSRKMGGPGVKPPQPERVIMEAFDNKEWKPSPGADRHRRGVYTFIIRTAPFAQGIIFDAPNPGEICAKRERSNTPLQALTLLNDETFFGAARALAARVRREARGPEQQRIAYAFALCLSRAPSQREIERAAACLEQLRKSRPLNQVGATEGTLPETVADSDESRAWTGLCSVLLNLHEFITRD